MSKFSDPRHLENVPGIYNNTARRDFNHGFYPSRNKQMIFFDLVLFFRESSKRTADDVPTCWQLIFFSPTNYGRYSCGENSSKFE